MKFKDEEATLIEVVKTQLGIEIEVWDVDFQHALDGHPEVTIERIRSSLEKPLRVVKSKKSNRACLFYNLEIEDDPVFGKVYFCVVVGVLGSGKGKMETAYETTYMKSGEILFDKESKK